MFECFVCNKKYTDEQIAINCCTQIREFDDGDWLLPAKCNGIKPVLKQHRCPNVTHGNKTWVVWLKVDEKCPMCDYVYRPR